MRSTRFIGERDLYFQVVFMSRVCLARARRLGDGVGFYGSYVQWFLAGLRVVSTYSDLGVLVFRGASMVASTSRSLNWFCVSLSSESGMLISLASLIVVVVVMRSECALWKLF